LILPLLGTLAGGTTLMVLGLDTDAQWLPVGYHWAWNTLQTAVLGSSDSVLSLPPLHIQGLKRWMWRSGQPEPELLSTSCIF
jgi:hypothetical protein